ncbi:alpha/beta fold hydrolase [Parahaliea mediterranea]|uniref:Alpha/beta hydrolase n=1 Tax=Parahaliea mediterranea TaxID=651086 RepID=A0A939ING8_9GAMM|nr:alpha/beta hydrolase [Parahaliea mediterranea]MBN7798108.1 alpha/beta hydrolase [Parahaliea mediterranea]
MEDRLESFGGSGTPLVFAHANGYPPGSYRQFLAPLAEHCEVIGYCHRPLWSNQPAPLRANWHLFARDLVDTLERRAAGPVWMMGHSLGAVVSLLAALKRPALFQGLVLLDPVFLPSRQALSVRLAPHKTLRRLPMVRKALGRPHRFGDTAEAFEFHRGKRAFAGMSDAVLWDYVRAGTRTAGTGVELAWSPAWEAAVYTSAPLVWPRLLRMRLPTLGLRGETSDVLSAAALRRWARLQPNAELHTCPGGHLLPLERPGETAALVLDFLGRQGALGPRDA